MAALTFPLAAANLADLLRVRNVIWTLQHSQELSGLGSGELLAIDLAPPLWSADVETVPMENAEAEGIMGRLESLGGSIESFILYSPRKQYPAADPDGSIYGSSTPTVHTVDADKKRLRITGLPSSYIITMGDLIQITYGSPSRVALVRALETVTASGGTTALFEVRPHLRPGIANGNAISLVKPSAKVKLVPGSERLESISKVHSVVRFSVRQTLAAG